jgi:CheY-like chemotaxis protein
MKMCKKVLLIDDDSDEHMLFQDALEMYDGSINCLVAKGYIQAVNLMKEETPDCIFLDFNMPVFNGLESLQKIKQTSLLNDIPVYIYSISDVGDREKSAAIQLGAEDWLKKPCLITEFHKLFSNVLG